MTTKTAKAVNWTPETTAKLVAAYAKGETPVKELSAMFGKSEQAIRSKLVSEKAYVPKAKSASASKTTKAEYVNAICILTGLKGLESFTNANMADLQKLADFLTKKF